MSLGKYSKFIVAIVGALVTAGVAYFGNDVPVWFNTVVAVLSALGVYAAKNSTEGQ